MPGIAKTIFFLEGEMGLEEGVDVRLLETRWVSYFFGCSFSCVCFSSKSVQVCL